MTNWQEEMTWLTILYRMLECKETIPVITNGTSYEFIESELENLSARKLIEIDTVNATYFITDEGKNICGKLLGMYDQVLKFEVFSSVNLAKTPDEKDMDEEGNLNPELYDPRFQKPASLVEQEEFGTEDMRIAMMDFLATEMETENPLDPHRIVFLQMLSTGKLKSDNIWFDLSLGEMFSKIEEIVTSAYQWKDCSDEEEDARQAMISIYTAGMLEQRKRDGQECSDCGSPLAMFEMWALEDGKTLDECPNPECECTFKPPPPEYECPVCNAGVVNGQSMCSCGAILDFSLPPGTIQTETTEEVIEEEPIWTCDYGYTPYGYYDPYDPFLDAVAFGTMCAILW
jgi:hypothetical protein